MQSKIITYAIFVSILGIIFSIATLIATFIKNLFLIGNLNYILITEFISSISKYNGLVLIFSIAIIYLVTAFMLSHCDSTFWETPFFQGVWKRILKSLPIIGMVSYNIVVINNIDLSTRCKIIKNRTFVKSIYALSVGSTVLGVLNIFAIFSSSSYVDIMKLLIFLEIILLYTFSLSTIIIYVFAVLDAVQRTQSEWEKVDFLSLINPAFWIFGLRKYYINYLLPASH
jgi:hypothetical protein